MPNIRPHIEALAQNLTAESYEHFKRELDMLADKIIAEEKDKHFREHPEQCQ